MAKFYGPVGYIDYETTGVDIISEKPIERMYKGDLISNTRRLSNGESINDTVTVSNRISILADPYARNHIHAMRYVKWANAYWKIDNVDVEYPRLILTLGGVYNGEVPKQSE